MEKVNEILEQIKAIVMVIPVLTSFFSVGGGLLHWLKNGEWYTYSSCQVMGLFCNNNTEYIGINKILDWVGRNDIFILVAFICVVIYVIADNADI